MPTAPSQQPLSRVEPSKLTQSAKGSLEPVTLSLDGPPNASGGPEHCIYSAHTHEGEVNVSFKTTATGPSSVKVCIAAGEKYETADYHRTMQLLP